MSTPLARVKERFGTKEKLVNAVEKLTTDELWIANLSSDRDGTRGLGHVSNAKLLRLHDTLSEVKEKFGNRSKLIDAVLKAEGRPKDADYRIRLEKFAVPRLYDQYKAKTRKATS